MGYLALGCQVLLGGVFAVSSGSKLHSRAAFADFTAATARLTGAHAARAFRFAVAVVAVEVVVVLALCTPWLARWGFVAAAGLLAVLTAAIVRSLRRGQRATCRCFGVSDAPLGTLHVARNAVLAALCALGVAAGAASTPDPGVACVAVAAALAGVVLVVRLDDVAGLFRATAVKP